MTANRSTHCAGCEREFRPRRAPAADYPGRVQFHSKGLCATCSSRQLRGIELGPMEPPRPKLFECPCGQLTRPRKMPPSEALKLDPRPTITRIGSVCFRCSEARVKITPARVAYVARELEAYFKWRGRDISALGLAS